MTSWLPAPLLPCPRPFRLGSSTFSAEWWRSWTEDDRFGFAYGTLPVHPERGEESFVLSRTEGGATFTICAVSQPIHPLARLAPPVGDFLQSLATARYLEAMKEAVS